MWVVRIYMSPLENTDQFLTLSQHGRSVLSLPGQENFPVNAIKVEIRCRIFRKKRFALNLSKESFH